MIARLAASARVRAWNAGRYLAARSSRSRTFNGMRMRVPWETAWAYWRPWFDHPYETEEWEAVTRFAPAGGRMIDVGANAGILSVAMARKASRVLACEPHPEVFRTLTRTLQLNDCANTTPVQALIMDQEAAAIPFHLSAVGSLGVRSSAAHRDPGARTIEVPATTLDRLIAERLDGRADYIKIDAEGAELKILRGAEKLLNQARPLLQIEVHGQYLPGLGDSVEALFAHLKARDYDALNLVTLRPTGIEEFVVCTHCHAPDDLTGQDVALQGYGQVLFYPRERSAEILGSVTPRPCPRC